MTTSASVALSEPSFWLRADREEVFAELRRDRPVIWQEEPLTDWSPGGRGYWAVLRHRDVREVSRRPEVFISGLGTELFELPPAVGETYSWLLNMDGAPAHTDASHRSGRLLAAPRRSAGGERA